MGGKNKQSQRTKNNVRPSSSGRSAELLSSAGKFDSTMTTVGGKLMPALFPTLAAVTLDAGLDPELAMCIKKLNKKDPITKTKALQELTELVNKSSVEDVVATLPSWSHFYKTLSVDGDCKVRECTQVCHGAIVRVCGRRTAPHLKQLLPPWLQAQYDDHAPAQTQAQLSLKNTFPDAKLPEVIAFCKTEIFEFLEDNLIGKSAIAAAAAEGEGGRRTAAALHGLAWSCRHAPRALSGWMCGRLLALLRGDGFWRLHSHTHCAVRCAWFGALSSIMERFPEALAGARALHVLLHAHERDARARAQLWGCLLLLLHSVPDWQKWLEKKDLLAKRILNLLETGGWGDARQLSKTLLPLLASLPPDMLTDQFFEDFFEAIFKGLDKKSQINSKLERQAWMTGLSECIRYVSTQPRARAAGLAAAALRRWLLAALHPPHDALLKHSAATMAELLKFWMRKARSEDGDRYATLVRNFWQNIGASVSAQSDAAQSDAARHALLLTALRAAAASPPARREIRFDGDASPEMEPASPVTPTEPASPVTPTEPADMELFYHNLATATEQVCARYIEIARDTNAPNTILPNLYPLLYSLSKSSIVAIALHLGANTVYGLFEKVLLPWLSDADTRGEAVMDVVFLLLTHMTEEEEDATFTTFTQDEVCKWALVRSLSHRHVERAGARAWLRGASAARALAAAARALSASDANLLLLALTPDHNDELLVNEATVSSVVDILMMSLSEEKSERLISTLSHLATTLAHKPPDNYTTLLITLFKINLTIQRGSPALSLESWLEARGAWLAGLAGLAGLPARGAGLAGLSGLQARAALVADAARALLTEAFCCTLSEDLKISTIDHATSLCPYLLTECEQQVPSNTEEIVQLIDQLFEQSSKLVEKSSSLDVFALRYDCIVSKLSCPFGDDNEAIRQIVKDCDEYDVDELKRGDLVNRLTDIMFRALSLRTLLLHRPDIDEPSEDIEQTWCNVLLKDEHIQAEFCRVLREYLIVHSLHEGYAFWPHYEIIERAKYKLDVAFQDIISETPTTLRRQILLSLSERAAKEGYYWAYARSYYEAKSMDQSDNQSVDVLDSANVDLDNLAEIVTGNGLYHSLQANLHWLPPSTPSTPSSEESPPPASAALRTAHLVMLRAAFASLEAEQAPKEIREQFANDAMLAAQGDAEPDVMVDLYYKFEKVIIGDREPRAVSWAGAVCSAAWAEYCARLLAERGWRLSAPHWDFATITLCSLVTAVTKLHTTKTALLCVSSLRLLRSVREFMTALPKECERRQPSPHVAALIDEWRDIFSPDIHTNLFNVILQILDSPPEGPISCHVSRALSALTTAAYSLQWAALRSTALQLPRVVRCAAAALTRACHRGYKYLAHGLLSALATELVLEDAQKLSTWSENNSEESPQPPPALSLSYFHEHYLNLLELLDLALPDIQVGEATCEMCCGADSRSVALGALLAADAVHAVCARARGDLTHHYIQLFRQEKYTDLLLTCAVRLLPQEVFAFAVNNDENQLADQYVNLFVNSPQLTLDEAEAGCCGGLGDVSALSCRALYHALAGPGQALARAAWAAWTPRAARMLGKLTAAAIAPQLLKQQFQRASRRARSLVDTELTLLAAAGEAQAVHTVEDQPLRLTITFSREHPLTPPRVQTPLAGPAAGAQWLAVYLGYQNGDLLSAISLWVTSVGAKMDKAPQCYICYCRLHPGEGVLPKVFCNQCKNKFHNACLRKWFTTSKKSNCPVCRAMF
ncbi:E3 ubiquitin-protein ligase listerin isoform X2 [Plodia interpunctella]|uniref:E3 ubiquitin-protein ligase listerin isoform X2 n=1 Tax=Plodia interpunctella TaxID=58824 RepID=UPI002368EAA8|nr:E3 ubiquitin-protein ligase listerin isoform X2 [Plodia interpunctella]